MTLRVYLYAGKDDKPYVSLKYINGALRLGYADANFNDEQEKRNSSCEKRNAVWNDEIARCKAAPK